MNLKFINLNVDFKNFQLKNINLNITNKNYIVLLGPSGSGKTTLIKTILGFNKIKSGKIFFNNQKLNDIPVEKRNIGYVPQEFCLFPNKNVKQNIMFGKNLNTEDYLNKIIQLLKIEDLLERNIKNLSGGEKQKVSIARALMQKPNLLILDEPFSAIDEFYKKELWFELKKITAKLNIPVIHITHNFDEAYNMGEYLILLDNGKILQADNKQLIFDKPVSEKAAMFLNYRNIFKCKVNKQNNNLYYLNSNNINFKIKSEIQLKNKTTICIKPQDIKIINPKYPLKPELQNNLFDGTITSETFYPTSVLLYFKVYGSENSYDFEIIIPNYIYKRYKLCKNKNIRISIWEPSIIIF